MKSYDEQERKILNERAEDYIDRITKAGFCSLYFPQSYQINADDEDGVTQTYCITTGTMILRNAKFDLLNGTSGRQKIFNTDVKYNITAFIKTLQKPSAREKAVKDRSSKPLKDAGIIGRFEERCWK